MAEGGGEKTEKPTEKKLREARNKGQVVRSDEIVTGLEMAAILVFFSCPRPRLHGSQH